MSTARFSRIGLLPRIIIAIVLGYLVAYIAPQWFLRLGVTFNSLFGQFLGFVIPLIIIGMVTSSITRLGGSAPRLLVITTLLAYISTITAGCFSYVCSIITLPNVVNPGLLSESLAQAAGPEPYFSITLTPFTDVMTALVFSFAVGLCLTTVSHDNVLRRAFIEFDDVVGRIINNAVIPLLPIYIFFTFALLSAGDSRAIITSFIAVIAFLFAMHIVWLILLYGVSGLLSGHNPFTALRNMLPAYFTALGTASSAATIPVSQAQMLRNGVSNQVAGFVAPLCATIHMSGSVLKIVACSIAILFMHGSAITPEVYIGFILMLGITLVAAAGVPGGAIMASLGLLSSILGMSDTDQSMMIALYIVMDNFGTACNVTGDGALALIINRIAKQD